MFKFIDKLLHPPKPPIANVITDSLKKSEVELELHRHQLEEHLQAMEFHAAIIAMYEKRIGRHSISKEPS